MLTLVGVGQRTLMKLMRQSDPRPDVQAVGGCEQAADFRGYRYAYALCREAGRLTKISPAESERVRNGSASK